MAAIAATENGTHCLHLQKFSTAFRIGEELYSVTPILLKDVAQLVEFLISFSKNKYNKDLDCDKVAFAVNQLVFRSLNGNPFGCYIVRDPQNTLVGHLTFDLGKQKPLIFISSDLNAKFFECTYHLWQWTREIFHQMTQREVKVHKDPLQQAKVFIAVSAKDSLQRELLRTEGFLIGDNPSDEPPEETLYHMIHSTPEEPLFYQACVKDVLGSAKKTFESWMAICKSKQSNGEPSEAKRSRCD